MIPPLWAEILFFSYIGYSYSIFAELSCSSFICDVQKTYALTKLNKFYSDLKMRLIALGVISILLLSTTLWLTFTATEALAQFFTCFGFTATIVGTPESDDIVGTDGRDIIVTLEGRDRVYALGGNDIICGSSGPNTIVGGADDDLIDGSNGTDFISGGNGNDRLIGGAGNDFLFGEDGDDRLESGAGNDSLFGEDGDDILFGDVVIDTSADRRNIDNGDGGLGSDTCFNIDNVTNCEA
jgi:Ca2+-binding RTX toxin-like protein